MFSEKEYLNKHDTIWEKLFKWDVCESIFAVKRQFIKPREIHTKQTLNKSGCVGWLDD